MRARNLVKAAAVSGVTVATLGMAAAPAMAAQGGAVQRYQVTTTDYTILVNGMYEHDFTVVTNPCDGSLAVTGVINVAGYTTETVSATESNGNITFTAVYDSTNNNAGYTWGGTLPVVGGTVTDFSGAGVSSAYATAVSTTPTSYANHGQYVSQNGGGTDAAHSCVGMPVTSNS